MLQFFGTCKEVQFQFPYFHAIKLFFIIVGTSNWLCNYICMYLCTTAKLHQQHRDIPKTTRARDQKIKTTYALVNKSVSNMSKDNLFF